MQLTIFAKRAQTKEGKVFYNYLSSLTNKLTGEVHAIRVKFRDDCGAPKPESCPRNIMVDKKNANLVTSNITKDNGDVIVSRTMWVSAWNDGPAYVDHSLDEYD